MRPEMAIAAIHPDTLSTVGTSACAILRLSAKDAAAERRVRSEALWATLFSTKLRKDCIFGALYQRVAKMRFGNKLKIGTRFLFLRFNQNM